MRTRRFEWGGAEATAAAIRAWVAEAAEPVDVLPIEREVVELGDEAVLALHDAFQVELELAQSGAAHA